MSAGHSRSTSKEKDDSEETKYDPTLDFFSEQFDPLKALVTSDVHPPVTDAKMYDNIAIYQSAHSSTSGQQRQESANKKQAAPVAGKSDFQRKWLPHQLPVKKERIPHEKNLLIGMAKAVGPLAALKKCVDEKIKVKIWTRHGHGIRGYIIAYLTMFDKHWNMSLEEVTEVWTRPKKRKIPPLENLIVSRSEIAAVEDADVFPKIEIIKSENAERKVETCRRELKELMIRGEQIAYICLLEDSPKQKIPVIVSSNFPS